MDVRPLKHLLPDQGPVLALDSLNPKKLCNYKILLIFLDFCNLPLGSGE